MGIYAHNNGNKLNDHTAVFIACKTFPLKYGIMWEM